MPLPLRLPHDTEQSSLCYVVGKDHSWHLLKKFLRNCHLCLYPIGLSLVTWLSSEAWESGKHSFLSGDLLFRCNCLHHKKVEELLMGSTYTLCFMSQYSGMRIKLLQSCLTLCDHGLWLTRFLCPWDPQARTLEWVSVPFSRGSSWSRDQTCASYVSCIDRCVLYHQRHLGNLWTTRVGRKYSKRLIMVIPFSGEVTDSCIFMLFCISKLD